MTQTIIALFIVALALVWVLMRIVKGGKKTSCNCCDCSNCTKSKKHTTHR